MRFKFCLFSSILALILANGCISKSANRGSGSKISIEEFTPYLGQWSGTLGYNDYGTKKWVTIPAALQLSKSDKENELAAFFTYPDEPSENQTEKLLVDSGGMKFDGCPVLEKMATPKSLIIVTGKQGADDDRAAFIRTTYNFSGSKLILSKEVRFGEKDSFLLRNRYELQK